AALRRHRPRGLRGLAAEGRWLSRPRRERDGHRDAALGPPPGLKRAELDHGAAPTAPAGAAGCPLAEVVDHPVDAPRRILLEGREPLERDHGVHVPCAHSTSMPAPTAAFTATS